MTREALKLALEKAYLAGFKVTANGYNMEFPFEHDGETPETDPNWIEQRNANIKEALAQPEQPEQEPVALVVSTAPDRIWLDLGFDPQDEYEVIFHELHDVTWSQDNASGNGIEYVRADTTPPKRPWVGLKDEFCITNMFDMGHYSLQIVFKSRKNADEFKAALKEKNT